MIISMIDGMKLYNKIMENRPKIIRNPYNRDLTIYINDKLIGSFKEEELKAKGLLN